MKPEEIRKLIGGYATGTLTDAEREALFAAALDDQELFNELAGEESLRELLSDPGARAEMLAAVAPRPRAWAWWRPAVAALAVATIGTVIVLLPRKSAPPAPVIVAEVKQAPAPEAPAVKDEAKLAPSPKRVRKTAPAPEAVPVPEAPKAEKPAVAVGTVGGVMGGIVSAPREAAPAAPPSPPPPPPSFRSAFVPLAGLQLQTGRAGNAQPVLGIRYSVVRDEVAGTVALRLTANANGFVSVAGGDPVALTAMQPYTTPPLSGSEVQVVFARTPIQALTGPVAVSTETAGAEVYVTTASPGPQLGFTVPLSRQ
jgi:hypothetical protein